jgi:hypothetical protein
MSIWRFQKQLAARLMAINMVNMVIGLLILPAGNFLRGLGQQALAWGAINIGFGLVTSRFVDHQFAKQADPFQPEVIQQTSQQVKTILIVAVFSDVLYMLGGVWYARHHRKDAFKRGTGIGVVIQGAMLFLFDLFHALDIGE